MKKFVSLVLIVLFLFPVTVMAKPAADVVISLDSNSNQFTKRFDMDATVEFRDKSLYNPQVYLSYHVYDIDDKELLWEGNRYPILMGKDGEGHSEISIDLTTLPDDVKYAKVKLDLVDEKNVYWLSAKEEIHVFSEDVIYKSDFVSKIISPLEFAIKKDPVIFLLNLLLCATFFAGVYWLKRRGFFYN